jgi:tRNA-specific 2-thiouridylase
VLGIDPVANNVVVGPKEALAVRVIDGIRPSWTEQPVTGAWTGLVQVRAHGEPMPATIEARADGVHIELDESAFGIAPGQAAVYYDGDRVVGSTTISATAA